MSYNSIGDYYKRDCPYSFNTASVSINGSSKDGKASISINKDFTRVNLNKYGDCNDPDKSHGLPELAYSEFTAISRCCELGSVAFNVNTSPEYESFDELPAILPSAGTIRYNNAHGNEVSSNLIAFIEWGAGHSWLRPQQPICSYGIQYSTDELEQFKPFKYGAIPSLPKAKLTISDVTRNDETLGPKAKENTEQKIYFSGAGDNEFYGSLGIGYNITVGGIENGEEFPSVINYIDEVTWGPGANGAVSWTDPFSKSWKFGFTIGGGGSSTDSGATSSYGYVTEYPDFPSWAASTEYLKYDIVTFEDIRYEAIVDMTREDNVISPLDDVNSSTDQSEKKWKLLDISDHIQITAIDNGIRIGFIGRYSTADRINSVRKIDPTPTLDANNHTMDNNVLIVSVNNPKNLVGVTFNTYYYVEPEQDPNYPEITIPGYWTTGPGAQTDYIEGILSEDEGQFNSTFIFEASEFSLDSAFSGTINFTMNGSFTTT